MSIEKQKPPISNRAAIEGYESRMADEEELPEIEAPDETMESFRQSIPEREAIDDAQIAELKERLGIAGTSGEDMPSRFEVRESPDGIVVRADDIRFLDSLGIRESEKDAGNLEMRFRERLDSGEDPEDVLSDAFYAASKQQAESKGLRRWFGGTSAKLAGARKAYLDRFRVLPREFRKEDGR